MKNFGTILIIDDNKDILFALNMLLKPMSESIKFATSPQKIEQFMHEFKPDIIMLDMNFSKDAISGQEGFDTLERILEIDKNAVVICMTAYADTDKAVNAIRHGATDFIAKPWDREKLLATLHSANELKRTKSENARLKEQVQAISSPTPASTLIIGNSPVMQQVFSTIGKVSQTDANILILGENGTGKDLVARMIYETSPRAENPFIPIDLGAIPEQLFESELFGYEKGAFTDARKAKAGRMEIANKGTLFLDEIGNLTLPMQAKLLTALEKRVINRLGSTQSIPIDIRLICATNADIFNMVNEERFRQDLLYRINTIEIHLPPLRERGEDILLLANHFMERYAKKYNKKIANINSEAGNRLMQYGWPGNVRELQHAIERAIILCDSGTLKPEHFSLNTVQSTPKKHTQSQPKTLAEIEKQAISEALIRCSGNVSKAATELGITRFALYRKMEKYEL